MYLNKVAFSEMIWRKTINLLPDLVQCKIKRGHCVSAKNQKCWKNESTWVFQKRSCIKNTLSLDSSLERLPRQPLKFDNGCHPDNGFRP